MGFAKHCILGKESPVQHSTYFIKNMYFFKQGIQKLASQYLKRDWPGIKADDRNDYR